VKAGTQLGLQVKSVMENGGLVTDDIILSLVRERITHADCVNGFLFDGFPRTIPQAQALLDSAIDIDVVLEIEVPDEEIVRRLSGRWVHPGSGRIYHVDSKPPKTPGKDDVSGEPLIQRDDDKEATVRKRLEVYHAQTKPLVDFYRNLSARDTGLRFITVSGVGDIAAIRSQLRQLLG